jgi:RNA polymerase sigma-70 factor (ECF subfamily)
MTAIEFSQKLVEQKHSLKSYALFLTRNSDDSDDLLQETLLKAFSNRNRFAPETNFKGWLFTIMKNTFINNYRRMVKRNTFLDATDNFYYLDSSSHSTGNDGENSFLAAEIEKALVQLPFELRESFLMNFRGYKYQEIADFFQIPIGTVKTRIHLARKVLKKKLSVHGWNSEEPAGV